MLRYSLFTLLLAVLGVALFCAALGNATEPWRDGTRLGLWLFLLGTLTAAIAARERGRAAAAGMAVFGLGFFYFLEDGRSRPAFVESAVDWAFVAVHGPPPDTADEKGGARPSRSIQEFMRQPRPGDGIFESISHDADVSYEMRELYEMRQACFSLITYAGLTMLVSLLGGGLGLVFHKRSRPPPLEMS